MDALLAILRDEEVNRFLALASGHDPGRGAKVLQGALCRKIRPAAGGYAYAICERADGRPIGYIGVDAQEPYDLGYGLRKEFWHKGFASEAAGGARPAGKAGRPALSHGDPRPKQPEKRRRDAECGHEIPVFL